MPRDIPHAWKNSGTETGRAFFIYTPGAAGKLFEEMRQAQPAASVSGPEAAQLFRRYGWEIVGPPPF